MQLENKIAIVTGSGNGIGRAIALRFAAAGARVTVAELEEEPGHETAAAIAAAGGKALFHQTDTADDNSVRAMVSATIERFGTVNLLVNNAAAFVFGSVEEVTRDDWDRVFGVNVIGYANTVRECLPEFHQNGAGAIVNIASVSY